MASLNISRKILFSTGLFWLGELRRQAEWINLTVELAECGFNDPDIQKF
jgi:hypothetical protein